MVKLSYGERDDYENMQKSVETVVLIVAVALNIKAKRKEMRLKMNTNGRKNGRVITR